MTWIGYTSLNTDMKRGNGATGVHGNPADGRNIIKLCFDVSFQYWVLTFWGGGPPQKIEVQILTKLLDD